MGSMASLSYKSTRSEEAYLAIKQDILQGILPPGEKLTETRLSEKLNTSRTPIREALKRLEKEGLVILKPQQGAEVIRLSRNAITDLYQLRSVLEGLAARKAAESLTKEELAQLKESVILGREYFAMGDIDKVVEKNTLFHDTILQASRSPALIQMMENVRTQILLYRQITGHIGFRSSFADDHMQLYEALANQDALQAENLMRQHIIKDLDTILSRLSI